MPMAWFDLRGKETLEGKVLSVQLLRGLAASIVAFGHFKLGFARYVGAGFSYEWFDVNLGALAVSIFFVISGYVMVVSSRALFAAQGGAANFAARRAVRILPPYWIATLLMAAALACDHRIVEPGAVWRSLAFIPLAGAGEGFSPGYVLWTGWTLFYELVFYAVFTLAMLIGRDRRVVIVAATSMLGLIALGGRLLDPVGLVSAPMTRLVVLLFVPGMLIAALRERDRALPAWLRLACAAGAIACYPLLIGGGNLLENDLGYVIRAGVPSVLVCLAVMGGPLRLPMGRLVSRFGDISFAVYLVHLPVGHVWVASFRHILRMGPWPFLIVGLVLVYAASYAFYTWVERPLTRTLTRALVPRPRPAPMLAAVAE